MDSNVFYIDGKWYSPDEATKLCESKDFFFETKETLYRTQNGGYFLVGYDIVAKMPTVKVISEVEALVYMDGHSAGIDKENYHAVFGKPERG